jgi:hypothetical protein
MQTWYECKVKFLKISQDGFEKKVTDIFLIDAVSFTDAETRAYEIMKELTSGDFQVTNIKKSNITDIIQNVEGEWWYKARIILTSIDEEAGKEKKVTNYCLVSANDIDEATKELHAGLEYVLMPYEVRAISRSLIAEVFPFIPQQVFTRIVVDENKLSEGKTMLSSTPLNLDEVLEDEN